MQVSNTESLRSSAERALAATAFTLVTALGTSLAAAQQPRMMVGMGSTNSARTGSLPGANGDSKSWTYVLTPFGWAPGLNGTVGVRNQSVDVSLSFSEILKHLDAVFMFPVEVWHGPLGIGGDLLYVKVSGGKATPGPLFTDGELDVKLFFAELGPRYHVVTRKSITVDAFVGGRYWSDKNTLTLAPGLLPAQQFSLDRHWIDPFLGARAMYSLSNRWMLQARADAGGFGVGSSFTWQAIGGAAYRASDLISIRAGWRQLHVDYKKDDFIFDVGLGGPVIGVSFTFGSGAHATSADR